ncbi:MAG: hypothetical protein WCG47_27840, partial [Dermatophilaceae bacterium]
MDRPRSPGGGAGEPDVGGVGLAGVGEPVGCWLLRLDVAAEGTGRVAGGPGVVETVVAEPVTAPGETALMLAGPSAVRFGAGGCGIWPGVLTAA